MSTLFSDEDLRCYDENGYVLAPRLFDESELSVWKKRFAELVEGEVAPGPSMLVMKDVMVAKGAVRPGSRSEAVAKIQDFHEDPVLFDGYARHPAILERVEALIGSDIKSIHSMLINKPPNVDGRHPLHQDLLYFPFRPADAIVASWTALDPCTRENGCLVVVPGSHKGGLREHENPDWEYVNFFYVGVKGVGNETSRVHLEMEPGDTVFFHPVLLHGSGRNRTASFRKAISTHYASAACRWIKGHEPIGEGRPYVLVRGREHEGCI